MTNETASAERGVRALIAALPSWLWHKVGGEICWLIVKPLPVPFDRPGTLRWRVMAWLWGMALFGEAVGTLSEHAAYRATLKDTKA